MKKLISYILIFFGINLIKKKNKIKVYEHVLQIYKSEDAGGFCQELSRASCDILMITKSHSYQMSYTYMFLYFPELYINKPNKKEMHSNAFWFDLRAKGGMIKRKEIIESILKELKSVAVVQYGKPTTVAVVQYGKPTTVAVVQYGKPTKGNSYIHKILLIVIFLGLIGCSKDELPKPNLPEFSASTNLEIKSKLDDVNVLGYVVYKNITRNQTYMTSIDTIINSGITNISFNYDITAASEDSIIREYLLDFNKGGMDIKSIFKLDTQSDETAHGSCEVPGILKRKGSYRLKWN